MAQTIIAGKPVHLQGARITPAQVEAFVKQKRIQLRSGVFLLSQLDGDIDKNAMSIIELKLANSRALERKPGPWRETWDVEYFLKALEEVFAKEEVDKFSEPAGVWRALMTTLQSSVKVEHSRAGELSLSYTAALVEANNKHPLHLTAVEQKVLEDLPRAFVSTHNPHRNDHANKAFAAELEERLREDSAYQSKPSLTGLLKTCEGLIVEWQKAQYNESVRGGGKRKDGNQESDRDKKQRPDYPPPAFKSGEYCEGCGVPRQKREACNLTRHPDFNPKGLWKDSEGYRKRKAYMESHGEGERHPALKWSKYASGGPITNAVFPDKMRLDRTDDRSRQHESAGDRRRVDEKADN